MFTGFRKMGENPKIDLIKPALLKIWWFVSGDRDKQEIKGKMYSTLFLYILCKDVILGAKKFTYLFDIIFDKTKNIHLTRNFLVHMIEMGTVILTMTQH